MKKGFFVFLALLAAIIVAIALWVSYAMFSIPSALNAGITPEKRIVITHVNVISMQENAPQVMPNQTVVVENGIITSVYQSTPEDEDALENSTHSSNSTRVINGNNRYLMPSLIDAHVHVSDEAELAGYLAYGVTGIRNMSGYPFHIALQKEIASGALLGPDFITTGPILNSPGPNANIIQQLVVSEDEARAAVIQQHQAGFERIKVYSNLTRSAFNAIVDEAQKRNMSITGHTPEGVRESGMPYEKPFAITWHDTLQANFRTLEHTETLIWHALEDDLNFEKLAPIASQLKQGNNVLVPTLIAHKRLVNIADTHGEYLHHPDADTINPLIRWVEQGAVDYWRQVDTSNYEQPHAAFFSKATGYLHQQGVRLLAGTDAGGFGLIPGRALHEELALLHESGLSPYEALQSATRYNAEVLGFENTGAVAPQFVGNLILLENNPLQNLSHLQQLDGLMLHGQWFSQNDIATLKQQAKDTSMTRSIVRALQLFWFIN